jgi:hypothetical protein
MSFPAGYTCSSSFGLLSFFSFQLLLTKQSWNFMFVLQHGHVGFMMSCYDAELSYDFRTDSFRARYWSVYDFSQWSVRLLACSMFLSQTNSVADYFCNLKLSIWYDLKLETLTLQVSTTRATNCRRGGRCALGQDQGSSGRNPCTWSACLWQPTSTPARR